LTNYDNVSRYISKNGK